MNRILLGNVSGSHGLQGWVKIFSYTDPIEAILEYSPWTLLKGEETKQLKVVTGRKHGKRLVALFEGVDERNQADELVGWEIHLDRKLLPDLEKGEFYWFQLQGLKVRNKQNVVFGKVDHLLETGAKDVLVVEPCEGSIDSRQRLIPYVDEEVVVEVNQKLGEIVVDWEVDY